jgi:hypothetical protein
LKPQDILDRVDEFRKIRPDAGSDEARLLEAALFVEDVFGLRLSDDEICERNLGTHEAMEQFVLNRCENK